MICLIVMIVAGILGIFSLSYRKIAGEAFRCVFRQTTFRKCDSGVDIRIKSNLVAKTMKHSPATARFIYKRFNLLSFIFTILLVGSLVWSGVSAYNLIVHNNCVGPDADPEECIFVPDNEVVQCKDPLCEGGECTECEGDCDCLDCAGT
jgi:hypothetical protein